MYSKAFLFILLFISIESFSQRQKRIDSLKQILNSHVKEDSTRVDILTSLHEALMFSKPEVAKKYAEEELRISQNIDYKAGIGKGYMHLADYYLNRNNTDSSVYYYSKAKNVFEALQKYRGMLFVNYAIADIERMNGNYKTSITILRENFELINKNEKNQISKIKFTGAVHSSMSQVYIDKGSLKLALIEALKALKSFEEINDEVRRADTLKLLGDIEYQLENYDKSINYYNNAIGVYRTEKDAFYLSLALNSGGKALKELNNLNEAKAYQNEAVNLAESVGAQASLAYALYDLGELSILEERLSNAKSYFLKSLEIAEKENIKTSIIDGYKGLAKIERLSNNNNSALNNINQAINIAKKIEAKSYLPNLLNERSKIFQGLNRFNEAIANLRDSQAINDSILSIKKIQQIEELSTIYETEKKETEIALQNEEIKTLNVKAKNDKLTKTLYGGGAISALALSGLLFFGFRQRMKKNKIEREKQEEIYKQEIAFKQKELASQTLHLVQKNTFLQELKENLENLKNSPDKFKMEFRRIVMLLKKQNTDNKDWEVFKSYFSEVHDNFDKKIKQVYNDITEKELRLASFIKMNLSTKEIAAMLNVLPDSVLKSKYRLKKKLRLGKETDLYTYLIEL